MNDVWKLETPTQEIASDIVNSLFESALNGKVSARNIIKKIYGNDWLTIKNRMSVEGSIWYVWYIDGVNQFIHDYMN